MSDAATSAARKALARLGRAVEKSQRELDSLRGSLQHAEAEDFPEERYATVEEAMITIAAFVEEEGSRLQAKILHAGGLEPGRVRRGG